MGIFENMIVSEFLKIRFNQGETDNLYSLRDSKGHEVDILLDYGTYLDMVEIKLGKTLTGDLLRGLSYFKKRYTQTRNCLLVYGGDLSRIQKGIQTVPWSTMASLEVE